MSERQTASNERESKKTGFVHAVKQLEIMRQAIVQNDARPVAIFTNRNGEREYLLLDTSFLNAMAGGVAGFYIEMKQFGMKDVADKALAELMPDD